MLQLELKWNIYIPYLNFRFNLMEDILKLYIEG